MKKIVSWTLVCVLLFGLTACGAKTPDIAGQWYNKTGDCLNIQSDGTYSIDREYGSGQWKVLDDGKTLQFTDYYGTVCETQVQKDSVGTYLDIRGYEVFYRGQYDEEKVERQQEEKKEEEMREGLDGAEKILELSPFSGGIAGVAYERDGMKYTSVINAKMQPIYTEEYVHRQVFCAAYGIGYLPISETEGIKVAINSDGKVIASVDSGEYDTILGTDNGYVVIQKTVADFNTNQSYIAVLDRNGNNVTDWIASEKYQLYNGEETNVRYLGSGVFVVYREYQTMFININTRKCVSSGLCLRFRDQNVISPAKHIAKRKLQDCFANGYAYLFDARWKQIHRISTNFDDEVIVETTNGGWNSDASVMYSTGYYSDTVNYWMLNGQQKQTRYEIGYGLGKNRLVGVVGADNKIYYTIVDDNDQMLFDPIQGELLSFSDDCFVLKKDEHTFCAYTMTGQPFGKGTFSGADFVMYVPFTEGAACVYMGGAAHFIDPSGSILL